MPVLDCGVNTITGVPQVGFSFGPTKKEARKFAIDMADALVAANFRAIEPTYACPPVECKNKNVAGIVNRSVKDLVSIQIMPALCFALVLISWDMRIECRYAA